MPTIPEPIFEKIRTHAFRYVTERQQIRTNLSLDSRVYGAGERIGPKAQGIHTEREAIVVFADDDPRANFGHPCRYLLYNPKTGDFLKEIPARFPPNLRKSTDRLTSFFAPVKFRNPVPYWYWPPPYFCPRRFPLGNRYAILYAGLTQARHLNDLEFAYRCLINMYGFSPANIYVLNWYGTRTVWDTTLGNWPGNNTPYTIQVTGQGTRAAFQAVFNELSGKLKSDDLLFIHTNNHGDNFNDGNGSFLAEFESDDSDPIGDGDWIPYYANDFASDLSVLPAYRALVVMMEQCNSGGFNAPILGSSTASSTSVSAAATAAVSSYASADGNWDTFAYEWIAAMNGCYPNDAPLASNPDTNHDDVVDTQEAYNYAVSQDSEDTPQFNASATGAGLTLDEPYIYLWLWCWILWPILEPVWRETFPPASFPPQPNPPDPAPYYALVNRVLPELQQLLTPSIESGLQHLRSSLGKEAASVVKRARRQAH
jgi:hypothetical protein